MTKLKLILGFVITAFIAGQAAEAIMVNGSIEFAGNNELLNNTGPDTGNMDVDADAVDFGLAIVSAASGSFSAIPAGIIGGTPATFTDFSFGELGTVGPLSVTPLWMVTYGDFDYSFALTAITSNALGSGQRTLAGVGEVSIVSNNQAVKSPYEVSIGSWEFSQSGDLTFTAASNVPDSGASAVLLGLGLLGLAGTARRFKR